MSHLLFVKLGDDVLTEGKAIDGLVPGTFITMYGRKIEVTEEDIPEFYDNTLAAIEATTAESGELVGLPIDAQNHEEDDAAGWIMGVELEGDLIRLVVKWTAIGVEAISTKKRRFFSANLDLVNKIIQGGSLTNWPATRDISTGITLLRPVELAQLSQDVYQLEESLDEITSRVRSAWWDQEGQREGEESWVVEVYEKHVIIERSDGYHSVAFSENEDNEIVFVEQAKWKSVEKSWIELARELARETAHRILAKLTGKEVSIEGNEPDDNDTHKLGGNDPSTTSEGDEIMTIKLEDLSKEDVTSLVAQLAVALGGSADPAASEDAPDITKLQDYIKVEARKQADELIAEAGRDADIVTLSAGMVGGTEEIPDGLPVTEDVMVAFLKSLDDDQREEAVKILEKIRSEGLVGFSETGHKKRVEGVTELDDETKVQLKAFIADEGKGSLAEFFEVNAAELGPMEDYDLAEFEPKKEGAK